MGSGVPYKTLQRPVVGRENETTIKKGKGNGAPVFGFPVCFFILSSCKKIWGFGILIAASY